jgi:glutathione synthase/RimK-type ligase-like ATP-grasp enzyme
VRLLVTSSRMPFALALIRRLAEAGHDVYACDTYAAAPGSHSRFLSGHFVTAAPRGEPQAFAADVERIAAEQELDLVVPSWEDAFYLAALAHDAPVYTAPFATLAKLHDKFSFKQLAADLGLRIPETVLVSTPEELREALARFPRYFARAVFSRGGVSLLTNQGPLAGHVAVEDVHPSEEIPWLVQEFVDGPMQCTYSTLHDGRITAHCAYRAPRQWEHSTGIQFLSVDGDESREIAERIGGALSYTGQLSFDFVASPDGLVMIECNPRTTDGVLLMSSEELSRGILEPGGEPPLVEAGREVQLDFAVLASALSESPRELPRALHDLIHVPGADSGWRDRMPTLYSFLAFAHHERLSRREHEQLFVAMSDDVCWNGEPIPGMSAADAETLAELERVRP